MKVILNDNNCKRNDRIMGELRRYRKDLESKGYNVVFIALYGSQNYNLDDENSDIDARAIVIPSLRDIIQKKVVSKVYEYEDGMVEVKDIMTFFNNLNKGNPAYVESIYSRWVITDEKFYEILKDYDVNPKAVLGMMNQKLTALKKGLALNSPTLKERGYDAKQIHHIIRLRDLYKDGKLLPYLYYDNEETAKELLYIKRNGLKKEIYTGEFLTVDEVINIAEQIIEEFNNNIKDIEFEQKPIRDDVFEYMENYIRELLKV